MKFINCLLSDVRADTLNLTRVTLRDVVLQHSRIGGIEGPDSEVTRTYVDSTKIDYMNFRGARLTDVLFENAELGALRLWGRVP